MKNTLSKETLNLIAARGIEETLQRMPKDEEDYVLLSTVFEGNKEAIIRRKNCPKCKENFQPGGPQCVCEAHYHDYCDCGRSDCLPCLFARSIGFDEVERIYPEGTEEEKEFVRGVMKSLKILDFPGPSPEKATDESIKQAGQLILEAFRIKNALKLFKEQGMFKFHKSTMQECIFRATRLILYYNELLDKQEELGL